MQHSTGNSRQRLLVRLAPPKCVGERRWRRAFCWCGNKAAATQCWLSLLREAATTASLLQTPERAYLALLQATLIFEQNGWPSAIAAWKYSSCGPPSCHDTVALFCPAARTDLPCCRRISALARRLLETTHIPAEIRWHITVFGNFACLFDDRPCDLSPLHRVLLVRLLDAGPAGLTVERLWEEVWGDTDIRMAALHKALARLREQTGLAMAARAGHCAIESAWEAIDYDAQAFERALATFTSRQELEQAVALYRGDFLPGAAPSAALWVDRRRSHVAAAVSGCPGTVGRADRA